MDKQEFIKELKEKGKVTVEPEKVIVHLRQQDGELGIEIYLKGEVVYLSRKSSFWQDKI
ncbi:MAG: hypothetical protein AB1349_01780 [Elusimicrobiota bacterium]